MINKCVLSIIVPAYNVADYLPKCLDSLLNGQSGDYEIILVDDGSKDETGRICDDYAEKNQKIKCFHKPNGGLSDARNFGISKSNGEYLMFVDSDDYLEPKSIEYFINKIHEYDADVYVGKSFYVDADKNIKDEVQYSIMEKKYSLKDFLKAQNKNPNSNIFCAQYFICRRELVFKEGLLFKTGIIHEDELWTPNLLLKSNSIYYCDFHFYYHIERSGSIMSSYKSEKSGKSLIYVCKELDRTYRLADLPLKYAKNHLAVLYLQAFTKIGLASKKEISKRILFRNGKYFKTRIKILVYLLSPRLYLCLWNKFVGAKLN